MLLATALAIFFKLLNHLFIMNEFKDGWYVIYTKPRHEKKVQNQLQEKQINSFLPTQRVLRSWHDRRKFISEPLFPSYVFVYLNSMRSFYDGIDSDGAVNYVRTGKDPARVSEMIVNNIRLLVDNISDIEVSDAQFQAGQELQIRQGPLTGLSCEIVKQQGIEKVLVRVNLLQRIILVTMPFDHLRFALN
jgi:transcriptional antiterminator RfaH